MKTEMYLRQRWKDHRLLPYYYNESILADFDPDDFVTIIENGGHDIWYPNIYFSDSVSEDTPGNTSDGSYDNYHDQIERDFHCGSHSSDVVHLCVISLSPNSSFHFPVYVI